MYISLSWGTLFTITDMIKGATFFSVIYSMQKSLGNLGNCFDSKMCLCPEGSKGCEGSEIFSFVTLFMVSL